MKDEIKPASIIMMIVLWLIVFTVAIMRHRSTQLPAGYFLIQTTNGYFQYCQTNRGAFERSVTAFASSNQAILWANKQDKQIHHWKGPVYDERIFSTVQTDSWVGQYWNTDTNK